MGVQLFLSDQHDELQLSPGSGCCGPDAHCPLPTAQQRQPESPTARCQEWTWNITGSEQQRQDDPFTAQGTQGTARCQVPFWNLSYDYNINGLTANYGQQPQTQCQYRRKQAPAAKNFLVNPNLAGGPC